MPILAEQRCMHPQGLLEHGLAADSRREWLVAYTKPRQEKAVARELLERQVPFYLPLVPRTHLIRSRKVRSLLPLFPSYLFLCVNDQERLSAVKTNRLVGLLPGGDQPQLLGELQRVHRLVEADAPLSVERRLVRGQRVRVKHGAFQGLEGTVLCRRRQVRLCVALTVLQQTVSVEIDDFLLEPL